MLKHIHLYLRTVSCLSIFLLLSGCYYLKQGATLLKYQCSAESNKSAIADSAMPQDIRKFLITVEDIRNFAVEKVGLKKTKNFSCYVKVNRDYLVDNVYAARADTFAQYFWHYPFFGAMPYKGFFSREDAEKEAGRLGKKGYDVAVGNVNGFSTLGILRDPVYSFMKDYGPYSLASLICHELTHATIFIKNQSQFNEEAATFVGSEAGLRYVSEKYGDTSEAYTKALLYTEDEKTYHRLINSLYLRLDSLYRSGVSGRQRIAAKNEMINAFKHNIANSYDSLFKTKSYVSLKEAVINNATIMITMTYTEDLGIYYELYKRCGSDLKRTVAALCKLRNMKGDPKKNLSEKLLR